MASPGGDHDENLLDRMEHIAEEENEDVVDDGDEEGDDESMDPGSLFHADQADEVGSGDSEEDDEFAEDDDYNEDTSERIEYHWNPTSPEESDGALGEFQISGISFDDINQSSLAFDGSSSENSSLYASSRRGSFNQQSRRRSSGRISIGSSQSAPLTSSSKLFSVTTSSAQRRVTISVPNEKGDEEDDMGRQGLSRRNVMRAQQSSQRRRQSVSLKSLSVPNSSSFSPEENEDSTTTTSSLKMSSIFSRKSTRRTFVGHKSHGYFASMDSAVSSLGNGSSNTEWENVAAAAAVVAAGSAPASGKRSHFQFAVDEKVLVFLNILNITNTVDSEESFTVIPVNKYGYPRGEGKSHEEQQGPFVYVLATVQKVHFDEDLRYYTVARADTGAMQRADAAWMEPIPTIAGIEAATRAAMRTSRSVAEKQDGVSEDRISWIRTVFLWPVEFASDVLIPLLLSARAATKRQITLVLFGRSPYSCLIRATGINILVVCSFIYLFLDVINLAFFPAESDLAVAVVGAIVWSILVLELLLEYLIRPSGYFGLIRSEKAYAPSTARNINSFHLLFEIIALLLYIPQFACLHTGNCGQRIPLSGMWMTMNAVLGPSKVDAALGRFFIGLRTLRIFSLVRHWKKMWINNTFQEGDGNRGKLTYLLMQGEDLNGRPVTQIIRKGKSKVDDETTAEENHAALQKAKDKRSSEDDQRLKKAATIGTALMIVNSHRALFLLMSVVIFLPLLLSFTQVNTTAQSMTDLLQENNIMAIDCDYLEVSIHSWLQGIALLQDLSTTSIDETYVLWARIFPAPRGCAFFDASGVITSCTEAQKGLATACTVWDEIAPQNPDDASAEYFAAALGIREGAIHELSRFYTGPLIGDFSVPEIENVTFTVEVIYNENHIVSLSNFSSFLLLLSSLLLVLVGLTVLRGDARRLVIHPLQRMLKIVVHYAENPLSQAASRKKKYRRKTSRETDHGDDNSISDTEKDGDTDQLGNYETEQLINAISKIADLLRKCWGVAGAGIISSNLARTQDGQTVVFNPTVPGKRVYALFGFVAINGFSNQLIALDRDVMILINDVAKVVHDEIYRWALGDSGQCNKNLGSSFLMVFRIGDFKEVHEKNARATNVVFSSNEKRPKKTSNTLRRRKQFSHGRGGSRTKHPNKTNDTLQLASLPGIQAFSDRALLGMLKSFAGIHREKRVTKWKRDFRLGAGVGAYTVNIVMGLDAGWAVEGAVGSEYKIDATYLSPHVNMAARMMSATKQYGVTILLSQAVEEILSAPARSKLRHLDTVYVKGSSVAQRIFTYDARDRGVDFFLFERSPEQADLDAESYSPMIWENDQDLIAMRQHVTDEFERKFMLAKDLYLSGHWNDAVRCFRDADEIMMRTVIDEGFIHYSPDEDVDTRIFDRSCQTEDIVRLRNELGDGPCKCLISYMEKCKGVPPDDWKGVRPLTSK